MYLSSVTLKNFRCYEDASFRFQPGLTLITGGNDAGKSALLDGIQALLGGAKLDVHDLRHLDGDGPAPLAVEVEGTMVGEDGDVVYRRVWRRVGEDFLGGDLERKTRVPTDPELRDALAVGLGKAPWTKGRQQEVLRARGIDPDGSAEEVRGRFIELCNGSPGEWAWVELAAKEGAGLQVEYHSHDQASDDPVREVEKHLKVYLGDVLAREKTKRSFAGMRGRVENAAKKGLRDIGDVFARYDGQPVHGEAVRPVIEVDLTKGFVLSDVSFRQGGGYRRMSRMGAAKRRKLQLALLEWRRQVSPKVKGPRVLLFDEPDTHFDYNGQRQMSKLLLELAGQDGVQVVVVTHSLNLIDRVDLFRISYLDQAEVDGTPSTSVVQPQEWGEVADVARGLGLRNHVVLNACLLLMEGQTEHALLPDLFEDVRGHPLNAIGVEVLKESQNGNAYAWDLCKHALRHRRRAFLVLDRDTSTAGVVTEQKVRAFNDLFEAPRIVDGDNLLYLGAVELEDIFPEVVLVEALHRYAKDHFAQRELRPPSRAALKRAVVNALARVTATPPGAYSKVLERTIRDELAVNAFRPSKPEVGKHILAVYKEGTRKAPNSLQGAFDLLARYAEA